MNTPRSVKIILTIGGLVVVALVVAVLLFFNQKLEKSHRANCIFNQRAMWSSAKAYMNTNGLKVGDPLNYADIMRQAGFQKLECRSGGTYRWSRVFPDFENGEPPASCSHEDHQPESRTKW